MIETARGLNYVMRIDTSKNRLRVKFFGDITDPAENKDIPANVKDACTRLAAGFTCLADFTEVGLFGLPDIAQQVQETLAVVHVRKVASVWSKEGFAKIVVQRSADHAAGGYAEKRKVFSDMAEAEAWLNS